MLISLDIDGTMEFGDPKGPITVEIARLLFERGHVVGAGSDWPPSSQVPLFAKHGMDLQFHGGKHNLPAVKERFPDAGDYVHIGDTDIDEFYALKAGFRFIHVNDLPQPLGPEWVDSFGL